MAFSFLLSSQSLTLNHPSLLPTTNPHLFPTPKPPTISFTPPPLHKLTISASSSSSPTITPIQSTPSRILTTLASLSFAATKLFARTIFNHEFNKVLIHSAGPAFFAAVKNQPIGPLNTPLTLVAAGLAKWLDIYSGVLMVRVLLSWFPNIPWEKQPLCAIRDLCDPYLNLFRNIIPPIFDTLDVSPLLAFAVLGTLGSILNSTRGSY